MAYGKGQFTTQDKILPGMYVNVKGEVELGSAVGSRGKVAVALNLDWGNDTGEIFKVTAKDFYTNCKAIFGYDYTDENGEMRILREIFKGATEVYCYRLNTSGGAKASASGFATAKYAGVRGEQLKINVEQNVDNTNKFNVTTVLDNVVVDRQMCVDKDTLKNNEFVTFLSDLTLEVGEKAFTGGKNGADGGTQQHNDFLKKLAAYQVNVVGCVYETTGIAPIYASWVKEQRDGYGNCLQAVLYNQAADHEGVINVDDSIALVPWVMGKSAGCPLNASLQNTIYDGEVTPTKTYSQAELEATIQAGKFILHRVGDTFRVLADINSLVTLTGTKTEDFKLNQTVRVIDQINIDACNIWNDNFLGKVVNSESGRISFWSAVIGLLNEYLSIGAIDEYDKELVTVAEGTQRGSVVMQIPVTVATMLEKAYVTIVVQ